MLNIYQKNWLDYMLNSENIFDLDITDHKIAGFYDEIADMPEIDDPV